MNLLNATRANVAYGYALLPMELIFPDLPINRVYSFSREENTYDYQLDAGF